MLMPYEEKIKKKKCFFLFFHFILHFVGQTRVNCLLVRGQRFSFLNFYYFLWARSTGSTQKHKEKKKKFHSLDNNFFTLFHLIRLLLLVADLFLRISNNCNPHMHRGIQWAQVNHSNDKLRSLKSICHNTRDQNENTMYTE